MTMFWHVQYTTIKNGEAWTKFASIGVRDLEGREVADVVMEDLVEINPNADKVLLDHITYENGTKKYFYSASRNVRWGNLKMNKIKVTKKQAIEWYESEYWKTLGLEKAAIMQLYTDLLFMPFENFHEGIEKALGRSVWTHEFAYAEELRTEYETGEMKAGPIEKILRTHTGGL